MISLDDSFELQNIEVSEGKLKVRTAFRTHFLATDVAAGSSFAAAHSVESPSTSETQFNLIMRNDITGDGYLHVVDQEASLLCRYHIGAVSKNPLITYGTAEHQILINGPSIEPIYGIVGGGLKRATKVASINALVPVIEVPSGVACSFADRIAIAQGNDVYFSDGSFGARSYISQNALALPGSIYDMYQGPSGMLVMTTSDGIYVLPSDALSQGQQVFGQISKISDYQASNYRNSVYSRNQIFVLMKDGLGIIGSESIATLPLTSYAGQRNLSRFVGPGRHGDYRTGTLWKINSGVMINISGKLCFYDADSNRVSWFYNDTDMTVVGVMRTRDGSDLIVLTDRVVEVVGNDEYTGTTIRGIASGIVPTEPVMSLAVREITTASTNTGFNQYAAVSGETSSGITPAPNRAKNIIGTDLWTAANKYTSSDMQSFRHILAGNRTDTVFVEVGADESCEDVAGFDIVTKGKSNRRPTN